MTDAHTAPETGSVLQLKVRLLGISPVIWRCVLVPETMSLHELHGVLQVAMGWEAIHLFQFSVRAVWTARGQCGALTAACPHSRASRPRIPRDPQQQPAFCTLEKEEIRKGRRERVMPLWHATQEILGQWIDRRPPLKHDGLFPNARGGIMNRHGFASLLAVHVENASRACPPLARKNVTPHVLRHSCAIHVLQESTAKFGAIEFRI